MKNYDDIINRFDDIQDLPVSEEMLGAYMEGNLRGAEIREIQNLICQDDNLFDLIGVVDSNNYSNNYDPFIKTDYISRMSALDAMAQSDTESLNLPTSVLSELVSTIQLNDNIALGGACGIINNDSTYSPDTNHVLVDGVDNNVDNSPFPIDE